MKVKSIIPINPSTPQRSAILKGLKKKISVIGLANKLGCSPKSITDEIETLRNEGYHISSDPNGEIELSGNIPREKPLKIDTKDYFGDDWVRFGLIADTHLCSKYARLDVLNALYDIYEREGIKVVYHCGNWIDGEARFNKNDILAAGFSNQYNYFLTNHPKRKGINTFLISGDDHEGWYAQREGMNVGQIMQQMAHDAGRTDLHDLGYMERDIEFKRGTGASTIRVIHAGGGSAYAHSYTSQKYVESLQGGEKPAIVLVGHYHKFDYSYPREVHVVQAGCVQDQTPFMRKKRLQAMVGGCLLECKQSGKGIFTRVRVEWMPFYDKKFYTFKW